MNKVMSSVSSSVLTMREKVMTMPIIMKSIDRSWRMAGAMPRCLAGTVSMTATPLGLLKMPAKKTRIIN